MSTLLETIPRKRRDRRLKGDRAVELDSSDGGNGSKEPFDVGVDAESDAIAPSVNESPWSIDRREELLNKHPVVTGKYTVPTPMLRRAHEEARDRVWTRRTGVVFFGETRAGKTTCAMSIRDFLRDEFKDIYITMESCRASERPSPGLMCRLILEGSNHVLSSREKHDKLLDNVIIDVFTNVSNLGGDQYVLILDEVNLGNERDFIELLQIHNILFLKGIRMTTISFGQPDILNRINSLQATNQPQIIARFFRKPIPFQSCDSEVILADVLRCLAEDTEWPEGSGWTYTYFFFPRAFRGGFRLVKYAAQIWSALLNVSPTRKGEFTMETIAITINGLYLGNYMRDAHEFELSNDEIAAALDAADL